MFSFKGNQVTCTSQRGAQLLDAAILPALDGADLSDQHTLILAVVKVRNVNPRALDFVKGLS